MPAPRPIPESRFALVYNGFAEGPAQPLRDHLLERGAAEIVTVAHPLVPEGPHHHEITQYRRGKLVSRREVRLPHRPPLTFPLDLMVPLRMPRTDLWVGFNPLAAARGLVARALHNTERVVTWNVDFVPDRFGPGVATRIYDAVDRLAATQADARVELSVVALEGRSQRHHLKPGRMAGVTVVPMGSWVQRVPTASDEAYSRRRVAYLGHLVPRQGVEVLVGALAVLRDRHFAVEADILGGGPELAALQTLVSEAGLDQRVRLHGFVADHRAVEQVIADASVAVAPYRRDPDSFTRFADPGKLKVYAAAGLPMVITDVPPTAGALASLGIATVVDDTPQAVADGIQGWFADEDRWRVGHLAALEYARGFDWETQFDRWLGSQGFG